MHPPHLTEEPILTSVEISSPASACWREGQRNIELTRIRRGGIQTVDSHKKKPSLFCNLFVQLGHFLQGAAAAFTPLSLLSRIHLLL